MNNWFSSLFNLPKKTWSSLKGKNLNWFAKNREKEKEKDGVYVADEREREQVSEGERK